MHFSYISLLSLLPLTMGIQTIYLGYVENSAQYVPPNTSFLTSTKFPSIPIPYP